MKSEGGVKKDKHSNFDLGFCLACVKAIAPLLIISSELIGEISPFGIVEDTLFLIANFISCAVAIHDCVKEGKGEKNDIYLLATGLTLVGSSVLLTRKVLTMLEVTELASLNPVVFPALGLLGVALLISGCALIVYSRSKELKKQSCRLTDLETSQANGHTHTEVEPIC
ncbi:hypothetical protein [Wolbachia endosymbiont of Ctenocephalides felis wCfeT]|uniref:hypothetical protein n=1 Tax=Wolbachia endosymbiont of Ctenocephalides felis wCfeT TaxID=2732593 RepID=UPI001445AAC2|nr:hypothetical protein [Wolbachia endosymbiont of Ctenocephalides felis wCfeT]